jgi:hypothetical protein
VAGRIMEPPPGVPLSYGGVEPTPSARGSQTRGGRATSLGRRVRERVSPDDAIDLHLAIISRDPERLARFNIPPSEVNVHVQQTSMRALEERGWGRAHQSASVEHVEASGERQLSEYSSAELREMAGLDADAA